jgi:hypothetical protein
MHPIQDLFLEGFSHVLQFDMHFICTPMWAKFYSCKKWVLQTVWSHNTIVYRATNFAPFQLLYGAKAVLPEKIKHRSLHTATEGPTCPSEVEEKDLLELERLKAVANLQKYQDDTKAWRDLKVRLRELDVGGLVLLRSPRTESAGKLEAKWVGSGRT